MEGRTLAHYRVLEKIGAGGMGVVYRAHDERLDRDVALKVLPGGLLSDDAARRRFRKEALALSRLNHPNIETVHDFDTQEGLDFLVMEYVPGQTLTEKLAGGALPEMEVAALGAQIASALEGAHERGVVHRDLKPGNILVTPKGQVKVLDFGLAMLLRPAGEASQIETMSQTHTLVGTLPYMAPEQLRGEKVDVRSDIYSAGAVLFEMSTRQRPFSQDSAPRLIDAIQYEAPPTPSAINRRISPALDRIILKALNKDPKRRYQSARELQVDLERLSAPVPMRLARRLRAQTFWWALASVGAWLTLVALLVGLNVGGMRDRLLGRAAPRRIESLAVLPLVNLSGDPGQEYFTDGMTEELIAQLAKIGALRVISRTSAMHFKGTDKPLPEIARLLNVDAIIEGSVMRSGERVRITAQLVEGATDRHLWAESYERDLRDILGLQSEVAQAIAQEIRVTLTPQEKARLASARPVDVETYEAYLKGRYYWNKRGEWLKKGLEYFEEAVQKDPGYAPAYSGLADSYILLVNWSYLPPSEAYPKARAAASRALEIDEGLAEGHTSLAAVKAGDDWDWEGAEGEFKRAIELKPGYATAHHWYGIFLARFGRFEEGLAELKRARDLDPLSLMINTNLGMAYEQMGRLDEAIEQIRKTLDLDPDFLGAHEALGNIYVEKGMYGEGLAELHKAERLAKGDPSVMEELGYAYGVSGQREEARKVIDALNAMSKRMYVSPVSVAIVHIGLGEKDRAFEMLERAYGERDPFIRDLKLDPRFGTLRSDPRFKDLLRRLGL